MKRDLARRYVPLLLFLGAPPKPAIAFADVEQRR
jgi:hypothetical protein